ncbi:hypothetical protein BpHYR1_028975 [Brachionus plicatilis]|uniref:Uncharacterized protein n=1 Tax=Brachionus plicatilis TaxID=10195 RepID=A0A3M7RUA5_BRAPC|nr:hypothetical protein BpHYR1_028975 [Brachionus plicatilis]
MLIRLVRSSFLLRMAAIIRESPMMPKKMKKNAAVAPNADPKRLVLRFICQKFLNILDQNFNFFLNSSLVIKVQLRRIFIQFTKTYSTDEIKIKNFFLTYVFTQILHPSAVGETKVLHFHPQSFKI